MNIPQVSVIILNYNGLKYLEKTIPSILNLTHESYEVIVIDNGSTDGSIDFLSKISGIRLIRNNKNLGYGFGKNIGVREALGEYVLFLDNDICINDYSILSKLVNLYEDGFGFIQIPLLDSGARLTKYYGLFFTHYGVNLHKPSIDINKIMSYGSDLIEIGGGTGASLFFKKNLWDKIGGMDEIQKFNIDDVDIGPRAWNYGYKNYLYTKSYFIHLGIAENISTQIYTERFKFLFSGHARAMIKNYNIKNTMIGFPMLLCFHFIKAIRFSFIMNSPRIFLAFLWSVGLFIKKFSDTMDKRRFIQSNRVVKSDQFLRVIPPKFI